MSRNSPAGSTAVITIAWYRQVWPWLLMLMPATAVVAGLTTFWLAYSTNDSLVVDDYYKEGRLINLELARDQRAAELGLHGALSRDASGHPELRLQSSANAAIAPTLTLRLIHATRAEKDQSIALSATAPGTWTSAAATLPTDGHWNIHLEDPQRQWRLVRSVKGFTQPVALGAQAK